jgi:hypothetical protein
MNETGPAHSKPLRTVEGFLPECRVLGTDDGGMAELHDVRAGGGRGQSNESGKSHDGGV